MIGEGKFAASIESCSILLRQNKLFAERNAHPSYPPSMPSELRKLSYTRMWSLCVENSWFDLKLSDSSLLQFKMLPEYLSYSFLAVPYESLTFEEFAQEQFGEEWEAVQDELGEEYEQYCAIETTEKAVTAVRYDYEPLLYREGAHPAGHMHFGSDNNIRVCVPKILTPLSFTLFVVRQYYPAQWEVMIRDQGNNIMLREAQLSLTGVDSKFLNELDYHELHLT